MEDYQADCNKKLKATIREANSANLNSSGKAGIKVCSTSQGKNLPKEPKGFHPYR